MKFGKTTSLLALFLATLSIGFASAQAPKSKRADTRVLAPQGAELPKFGMSLSRIEGYGMRVNYVAPNSRAARMGIEAGDILMRMNNHRLKRLGNWKAGLYEAVASDGQVRIVIRDVRTGKFVQRSTWVPVSGHLVSG